MFEQCRRLFLAVTLAIALPAFASAQELDGADFIFPEVIDTENRLYMELLRGRVVIDLHPDLAPAHVIRIKELARQGFYDGLNFHRVIDGFMAQTGDPTGTGMGGSELEDLPDEFSDEPFKRGAVGMARGEEYNTGNSQFFIMVADGPWLVGEHTLFGTVTSGMELIDDLRVGSKLDNGLVKNPDVLYTLKVLADIEHRVLVAGQTKAEAEDAVIASQAAAQFEIVAAQDAQTALERANFLAEQASFAATDTIVKTQIMEEAKEAAEAADKLTKQTTRLFELARKRSGNAAESQGNADDVAARLLAVSQRADADLASLLEASRAADAVVKTARRELEEASKTDERAAKAAIAAEIALPKAMAAMEKAGVEELQALTRNRKNAIRRATQRFEQRYNASEQAKIDAVETKAAAKAAVEAVLVAIETLFVATEEALVKSQPIAEAEEAAQKAAQEYAAAAKIAEFASESTEVSQDALVEAQDALQSAIAAQALADAAFMEAALAKEAAIVAQAIAEEAGILGRVLAVQMASRAEDAVRANIKAANYAIEASSKAVVAAQAVEADIPISQREKTQ